MAGAEYMVGLCLVQEVPVMLLDIDALLTFKEKAQLGYLTPEQGETYLQRKSTAC
jgi:purine-binding chemotaxis protein CheW